MIVWCGFVYLSCCCLLLVCVVLRMVVVSGSVLSVVGCL